MRRRRPGADRLPRDVCPLCNAAYARVDAPDGGVDDDGMLRVACRRCGEFGIAAADRERIAVQRRTGSGTDDGFPLGAWHLVAGHLREMTLAGHGGLRLTPEAARAMAASAPTHVTERIDRLLVNLAALTRFPGMRLRVDHETDHVLCYAEPGGELAFFLNHLATEGLLDRDGERGADVTVSVRGWTRVEALRAAASALRRAFVALPAEAWDETVYCEAIAPAIVRAGYEPVRPAGDTNSGEVDGRTLLELSRSRFVVADLTRPAPDVWFAAGYALGRGLPVIGILHAAAADGTATVTVPGDPLVWRQPEELQAALYARIKVSVG